MKIDNEVLIALYAKLEDAKETRTFFSEMGDWNMVKAWAEQIEFINERITKEMKNEFGSK